MTIQIRTVDVSPGGSVSLLDGLDRARPPTDSTVRWIDVCAPDEPGMKLLADRFALHPLTVEDCLHVDQRPKAEEYGEYLFVVMHAFGEKDRVSCEIEPLDNFSGLAARRIPADPQRVRSFRGYILER